MEETALPSPKPREPTRKPFALARAISKKLGRVPSLIWAAIYLVCIPCFASFYTALPSGAWFYGTIAHEARYVHSKEIFEGAIEDWAKAKLEPSLSKAITQAGLPTPDEISYSASYDEAHLRPTLDVSLSYPDEQLDTELSFYLRRGTFSLYIGGTGRQFTARFRMVAVCAEKDDHCSAERIQTILEHPDSYTSTTFSLTSAVEVLWLESEGLSAGPTRDTFFRMLYLSAVTITTVGYGDIVPLTDAARAAVASEAIIGIVLIGLFLNALSWERDH